VQIGPRTENRISTALAVRLPIWHSLSSSRALRPPLPQHGIARSEIGAAQISSPFGRIKADVRPTLARHGEEQRERSGTLVDEGGLHLESVPLPSAALAAVTEANNDAWSCDASV